MNESFPPYRSRLTEYFQGRRHRIDAASFDAANSDAATFETTATSPLGLDPRSREPQLAGAFDAEDGAFWDAGEADAAGPLPIDFEQIPTRADVEQGHAEMPAISLVDEPHAIALPDVYEPGYSYPLIVWFHGTGGTEDDIFEILPKISERNYLALAIRGPLPAGEGAQWSTAVGGTEALLRKLEDALTAMQRTFRIHPERIYLAGTGTGGTTALELLLERPTMFAGAAALCSEFPTIENPLAKFRGLRGRRVLLATSMDCPDVKVIDMVNSGRLLYAAGLQVGTRIYQQTGGSASDKMYRDLDHWLMDGIQSAVHVSTR